MGNDNSTAAPVGEVRARSAGVVSRCLPPAETIMDPVTGAPVVQLQPNHGWIGVNERKAENTTFSLMQKFRKTLTTTGFPKPGEETGELLDLRHITDRVIACAAPTVEDSVKYKSWGKNYHDDVKNYLDTMIDTYPQYDQYMVVNVREEKPHNGDKEWDKNIGHAITDWTWSDHEVPIFEDFNKLLTSIDSVMASNPRLVLVVHCQAGKARTGTVICAFLARHIYNTENAPLMDTINTFLEAKDSTVKRRSEERRLASNTDNVLTTKNAIVDYYSSRRMKKNRGVRRPCQQRWIWYDLRRRSMREGEWSRRAGIVWKISRIDITHPGEIDVTSIRISRKGTSEKNPNELLNPSNFEPSEAFRKQLREAQGRLTSSFRANLDRVDDFSAFEAMNQTMNPTEHLLATGDIKNATYAQAQATQDVEAGEQAVRYFDLYHTEDFSDVRASGDCRIEFNPCPRGAKMKGTDFYIDMHTAFLEPDRRGFATLTLHACQMDSHDGDYKEKTVPFKVQITFEIVQP